MTAPELPAWNTLAPRARLLFYLQAFSRLVLFWLPVTLVLTLALAAYWRATGALAVGVGWLLLQFLAAVWLPSLSFDRWAWALRPEDLLIARGVWMRSITAIPVSRIQHVDTRQGPIEQWLGLARVQIHTASGVGSDGVIPGLEKAEAETLRDQLLRVSGDGGV